MSPARYRIALAVALVTAAVALLLRYESARHEMTGLASSCSVSARLDCDAVQASPYARVLGVSLATWGAAGALTLFLWLLAARREPALLVLAGVTSALCLCVVLYTATVSWVVLRKVCIYCTAMQAGFIGLAVLVAPAAWRARALLPRRPLLLGGTAGAVVLALALSGEAYAAERAHLRRLFDVPDKAMRLDVSDTLLIGDPTTRVSVVVFFDFGCPHCLRCYEHAVKLIRNHPGCVHFRFKHFPLDRECNRELASVVHPVACRAAIAGQAAQAVGLDSQAMKVIFSHQADGFGKPVLFRIGEELGVPRGKWAALLASPEVNALVQRDIREGNALKLPKVPIAYVNGRAVDAERIGEPVERLCR